MDFIVRRRIFAVDLSVALSGNPAGGEGYRIYKRKVLFSQNQSEVYLAQHSGIADRNIVVKVYEERDLGR
jgi:hypothetical protein